GGQQQGIAPPVRLECGRRLVDDIDEWNAAQPRHRLGHQMHGVGANEHTGRAAPSQARAGFAEESARIFPAPSLLQLDYPVKVERTQGNFGRVQSATQGTDALIDAPIIDRGGFPAHAADQTDGFHFYPRASDHAYYGPGAG